MGEKMPEPEKLVLLRVPEGEVPAAEFFHDRKSAVRAHWFSYEADPICDSARLVTLDDALVEKAARALQKEWNSRWTQDPLCQLGARVCAKAALRVAFGEEG